MPQIGSRAAARDQQHQLATCQRPPMQRTCRGAQGQLSPLLGAATRPGAVSKAAADALAANGHTQPPVAAAAVVAVEAAASTGSGSVAAVAGAGAEALIASVAAAPVAAVTAAVEAGAAALANRGRLDEAAAEFRLIWPRRRPWRPMPPAAPACAPQSVAFVSAKQP